MSRTKHADLERRVGIITRQYDLPVYGWRREGDRNVATVGALTLDRSNGGTRLMQVASEGGGLFERSPRLAAGEMATFLDGMLAVADVVRDREGIE